MGKIENVPKNGYNAFHKYHYTMESDLVKAIRPHLAKAGIMIVPSTMVHTKDGELTIIEVNYEITDGANSIMVPSIGYGSDKGDKGAYKAMTGSLKYALMKAFLIDTGDDPEGDTKTDERAASAPPVVSSASLPHAQRGGHSTVATPAQIRTFLERTVTDMGMDRVAVVAYIKDTLGRMPEVYWDDDDDTQRGAIVNFLRDLPAEDMDRLLKGLPK